MCIFAAYALCAEADRLLQQLLGEHCVCVCVCLCVCIEADKLLQQLLGERPWEPTSIASRFHQHSNTGSCHDDNPAPCSLESIPPTPTTPYTPTTPTTPATPYTPNGCFSPGTPNSNVGFADVTLSFDNVRDHIECLRLMAEVQQRACKVSPLWNSVRMYWHACEVQHRACKVCFGTVHACVSIHVRCSTGHVR